MSEAKEQDNNRKDWESLFRHLLDGMSNAELISSKNKINLATQIGKYQVEHHMTTQQFAKYLGVSRGKVEEYEGGDYDFSLNELAYIADRLGMTLDVRFENIVPEQNRINSTG